MDAVYLYKRTQDERELLYSLRSLKNFLPLERVFIVGERPRKELWHVHFINVPVFQFYEDKDMCSEVNRCNALRVICSAYDVSDDFLYIEDDMYILKPITSIPYYYLYDLQTAYNLHKNKKNGYSELIVNTCEYFENKGYFFEPHVPIIFNKTKLLNCLNAYPVRKPVLKRSLYCNFYNIEGIKLQEDVKIRKVRDIPVYSEYKNVFLSSSDSFVNSRRFIEFLEKSFPKKSKYEERSADNNTDVP